MKVGAREGKEWEGLRGVCMCVCEEVGGERKESQREERERETERERERETGGSW